MSLRVMFAKVVERYDVLNHILTLGLDRFWRKILAKHCKHGYDDGVVVDLCCGTGELMLKLGKLTSSNSIVVGLDFTQEMLIKAKEKIKKMDASDSKREAAKKMDLILADVNALPFRDSVIKCIGQSFSFRNLTFRNCLATIYLGEILRVLSSKGSFMFVESSQPKARLLKILYHHYLEKIIPLLGGFISGYRPAYRYLGISAANFPTADEVKEMLVKIGFQKVSFTQTFFGIVSIHICTKQ